MPATTPMTPESLQADIVRLDAEIVRLSTLLTEKSGESDGLRRRLQELIDEMEGPDGLRAQLTAAQAATAQARLERNVGCAIAAIVALFIGGLIGFWVAPKGDTNGLKADIVRLEDDLKKAKKEAADCRNTVPPATPTVPAPTPTPVPATGTTGGSPAIADATTVVVINPGGNGQQPSVTVEKKRGGTQVTPQAPAPAPAASNPRPQTGVTFWGWIHPNASPTNKMACYTDRPTTEKMPAGCSQTTVEPATPSETETDWSARMSRKAGFQRFTVERANVQ